MTNSSVYHYYNEQNRPLLNRNAHTSPYPQNIAEKLEKLAEYDPQFRVRLDEGTYSIGQLEFALYVDDRERTQMLGKYAPQFASKDPQTIQKAAEDFTKEWEFMRLKFETHKEVAYLRASLQNVPRFPAPPQSYPIPKR